MRVVWFIALGLALTCSSRAEPPDVSAEINRTFAGETVIHLSFITTASADKIWRALSVPSELTKWAAPKVRVELKAGGFYEYYFRPERAEGKRGMENTRILSFVPGKMLSHTGSLLDTWIVWSIDPAGDQQVVHYYAVGTTADWSDTAGARVSGMTELMEKLAKYLQP